MIDYKLAKQLKEAGWKQVPENHIAIMDVKKKKVIWEGSVPTLPELIKALGDKFSNLKQMTGVELDYDWVKEKGTWHAETQKNGNVYDCASGFTREEAVAKLWLQLQKK